MTPYGTAEQNKEKLSIIDVKLITLLHADNQLIITKDENDLQISVFQLNEIIQNYYLRTSTAKLK
jgi:hypothetical protein